jgi:diguanylate cyclase (GGDEF)-like protein
MKRGKPRTIPDENQQISELIETMYQTGKRLEELTAGQVDTVVDRDGRTLLLRGTQEQLRQSEAARQASILNALPAHIALLDAQGTIVSVNDAWRRFAAANFAKQEGKFEIGANYLDVCDQAMGEGSSEARFAATGIREVLEGSKKSFTIEYRCDSESQQCWFLLTVTPLVDNHPDGVIAMHLNITEQKRAALEMTHSAEHDFLTGLPNRLLLRDRFGQAITFAARHQKRVAVLFLDMDGFKHINDSLGHSSGDQLLQSVAKRLVDAVRGTDTVSRQGGDEFIVLLSEVEHTHDTAVAARRILESVAKPHTIGENDLHVTISIGISLYPEDGQDAETLIKNADTAMYQAKENGRQSYQFFQPAMNIRAVQRQSIEESLRRALERNELTLHYQPKVNLKTGKISGVEALLRWMHATKGPISPAQFIPVAEDCGLILPISNWVLREACRQAKAWLDAGLPLSNLAVNISAIQFRGESFLADVFAVLEETGLDPRILELELTETVLMKRVDLAQSTLKALRGEGIRFAIDDFGTGYSSLSYLTKLPVDALKIDQSFVRQITLAPSETTVVTAVISMAKSLNLRVVAEGVETREELAFLERHECDEAQGYYFSRAIAAPEFAKLLANGLAKTVKANT